MRKEVRITHVLSCMGRMNGEAFLMASVTGGHFISPCVFAHAQETCVPNEKCILGGSQLCVTHRDVPKNLPDFLFSFVLPFCFLEVCIMMFLHKADL